MRTSQEFRFSFRGRSGSGGPHLRAHCNFSGEDGASAPLVGFVVPKRIMKTAVERNRTKRQLRHLMRPRLEQLPDGTHLVLRVTGRPGQGGWAPALDRALGKVLKRSGEITDG